MIDQAASNTMNDATGPSCILVDASTVIVPLAALVLPISEIWPWCAAMQYMLGWP